MANHVLLATPTSLIALLRAVAYGWQQDALAQNAREVQLLGAQLYERLALLGEHFAGVGKGLNSAVTAYNKAVGSLESRVLVTARRFVDMGVVGVGEKELAHPATVETTTRVLQAAELGPPPSGCHYCPESALQTMPWMSSPVPTRLPTTASPSGVPAHPGWPSSVRISVRQTGKSGRVRERPLASRG